MGARICKNCQYHRENSWCSNSKSMNYRYAKSPRIRDIFMLPHGTCDQFYLRGKKAPLWMRAANWVLRIINMKRRHK